MKTGIELIAEEREKQISKYGYTPQHDCGYQNNELLRAALTYLKAAMGCESTSDWPFDLKYFHNDGNDPAEIKNRQIAVSILQSILELLKNADNCHII